MFFQWHQYLWLMLALPLLPVAYLWLLRRRTQVAMRFSHLGTVRAAMAGRSWRRHVPPVLLLLACAALLFAAARPVAKVPLPWARTTIVLAIDISLSMRVNDVKPTRMKAAQDAAKLFLKDLPKNVEVALVTFAGSTQVAQAATLEHETVVAAIDGIQMQRGTAIGSAIAMSLAELFPDHGIDLGEMTFGPYGGNNGGNNSNKPRARSLDDKVKPPPKEITPVAPGSYASAVIILLTDGRRTTGIDTLQAAKMAADRGVRIHVVGLGNANGGGSFDTEGLAMYLQLDEPTLREVARRTGGDYHQADSSDKLRDIYATLGSQMQVVRRETELAPLLALLGALLAATAGGLSVLWFRRLA